MAEIYKTPHLIDEVYLKEYSPIPNNFNINDIEPFIPIAEEIWVIDIIGRKLYDELIEQISTNTLTGENSTLLLKMYPYLSMAIVYESLPFIAYHISEKGITAGVSENSEPIAPSELSNMQVTLRTQLEVLKKMFKNFLKEHSECFPSYNVNNSDCSCNIDDCDTFAMFVWGAERIESERYIKWYNFYNQLKHQPNCNVRLYSNRRRFPYTR